MLNEHLCLLHVACNCFCKGHLIGVTVNAEHAECIVICIKNCFEMGFFLSFFCLFLGFVLGFI